MYLTIFAVILLVSFCLLITSYIKNHRQVTGKVVQKYIQPDQSWKTVQGENYILPTRQPVVYTKQVFLFCHDPQTQIVVVETDLGNKIQLYVQPDTYAGLKEGDIYTSRPGEMERPVFHAVEVNY